MHQYFCIRVFRFFIEIHRYFFLKKKIVNSFCMATIQKLLTFFFSKTTAFFIIIMIFFFFFFLIFVLHCINLKTSFSWWCFEQLGPEVLLFFKRETFPCVQLAKEKKICLLYTQMYFIIMPESRICWMICIHWLTFAMLNKLTLVLLNKFRCQAHLYLQPISRPRWLSWMGPLTGDWEVAGSTPA